jgi:predicted RNase H-like HicB family nuclease
MVSTFTARYIKTDSGYMGQIIEWPEVVTEGVDLEDCRASWRQTSSASRLGWESPGSIDRAIPQDAARTPAPPTGG